LEDTGKYDPGRPDHFSFCIGSQTCSMEVGVVAKHVNILGVLLFWNSKLQQLYKLLRTKALVWIMCIGWKSSKSFLEKSCIGIGSL